MALHVVETSMRSRMGPPDLSADLMLIQPHIVAVISGMNVNPEADAAQPRGMTPARFAAAVGLAGLRTLDPRATLPEAVEALSSGLSAALERVKPAGRSLNVGYSFAAVSNARREIWRVGNAYVLPDAHAGGREQGPNILPSLQAVAQARSVILHALMARTGAKAEALRENDPVRPMLTPLLVAHASVVNSHGPLAYGLVNGQPIPAEHLHVQPLPPGSREVVLGTGGYPALLPTLTLTEKHLTTLLDDDPLLITRFPYIRPVRPGHVGYADRAYLRVRVW